MSDCQACLGTLFPLLTCLLMLSSQADTSSHLSTKEVLVQAICMFKEDEEDCVFMVSLPPLPQLQAHIDATETVLQCLAQCFGANS